MWHCAKLVSNTPNAGFHLTSITINTIKSWFKPLSHEVLSFSCRSKNYLVARSLLGTYFMVVDKAIAPFEFYQQTRTTHYGLQSGDGSR